MIIRLSSIEHNMSDNFSGSFTDLRSWSLSVFSSYYSHDIFSAGSCNEFGRCISCSWSITSIQSL